MTRLEEIREFVDRGEHLDENDGRWLLRQLEEARRRLEKCAYALESSYNVQDYPADGNTIQDHAAEEARAFLAELETKPVANGGGK